MSSHAFLKRGMKKYSRDATRRKSSLNVDLNFPPPPEQVEAQPPEGTSAVPQAAAAEAVTSGFPSSPIDIEGIEDDDVQTLSSPRAFRQARNQSRSKQPVTVVLDDDPESSTGTSVINVEDHFSRVPLSSYKRLRKLSPNRVITNREAYVNVEDDFSAKRKKAPSSQYDQEKVVPKEPVFNCPICMNSLVNACSTICGHVFCQACIKQTIQAQKKCPTCRRKLTMCNFHRVFLPTSS